MVDSSNNQGVNILIMAIFFSLALKGCKSKALPGEKINIDGKVLERGKVLFMSHPEVAKWEYEILRRQRERKLKKVPPQKGGWRKGSGQGGGI